MLAAGEEWVSAREPEGLGRRGRGLPAWAGQRRPPAGPRRPGFGFRGAACQATYLGERGGGLAGGLGQPRPDPSPTVWLSSAHLLRRGGGEEGERRGEKRERGGKRGREEGEE